jgi:hypothetical protein
MAMPEEVVGSLHGVGETRMKHNKSNRGGGREKEIGQRAKLGIAREHSALQDKKLLVHLSHNLLNLVHIES